MCPMCELFWRCGRDKRSKRNRLMVSGLPHSTCWPPDTSIAWSSCSPGLAHGLHVIVIASEFAVFSGSKCTV